MKVLFLQEYVRQNHVFERNGNLSVNFKQTESGKMLTALMKTIGLTARDYLVDYDYDLIPEPQKVDSKTGKVIKYKTPTLAMRKEPEKRLTERLLETQPDIIVPMGEMGCKNFLGVTSITKSRGVPSKVTITHPDTGQSFETWLFPMFSMEYLAMNPNIENLVQADLNTLDKFLKQGEKVFQPTPVEYELVMTMERVREIFNFLYKFKPLTAWDLETNTLRSELLGAKPLVMTMSWAEGQGVTIPLEHSESPWTESELAEVYSLMKVFLGDKKQAKVGHNLQYDVRFLMSTKGFSEFWDCRDTKIGYFLVITQESEDSKRLSDLAYEFTDMGGYDTPLEDFKKKYVADFVANGVAKIAEDKAEAKERIERDYKVAMAEYKQTCKEYKEIGKPIKSIPKPVKEKMPKFPTKTEIKPVNEVDGSEFNYGWIPLEILHPYASGDTDCCLRIYNQLVERMADLPKMYELWTEFYPNLTRALAHIESQGMLVDADYAQIIDTEYSKEERRILAEIRKFPAVQQLEEEHMALYQAGLAEWAKPPKERDSDIAKLRDKYKISDTENKVEFNPSSSVHKGKLLYKIMGLALPYDKESIKDKPFDDGVPESDITWEDYRTNKHALEYLADNFEQAKEIAQLLLDYSKVNTLKNNFAQKLPAMASNKDGRVHGSFNISGTATSRLSSSNPNLQQIPRKVGDPRRFDYNYPIKRLFKTSFEHGAIIQADYSSLN